MFQYTSTNLINSANQYQVVEKNGKKLFRMNYGPAFKDADKDTICVYKAPFKEEVADEVTIDLSSLEADKDYRLNMYIRSVGNADPIYANDFVFKGKPFYVEFTGNKAEKVANIATKYMLALYDHPQMTVKAEGSTLTLKGVNGYQRFFYVSIEEWVADETVEHGHYEVIDTTVDCIAEDGVITSEEGMIMITVGCEGFGTYDQVLKDLRLPTGDNFAYLNANALQMPVIGGEYTQYTVCMRKALVGYPGGIGINNPVESITNHVFFVIDAEKDAFEAALTDLGLTIEEVPSAEASSSTEDSSTDSTL